MKYKLYEKVSLGDLEGSPVSQPPRRRYTKCRLFGKIVCLTTSLLILAATALILEMAVCFLIKSHIADCMKNEQPLCAVDIAVREPCLPLAGIVEEGDCLRLGCCWDNETYSDLSATCFIPLNITSSDDSKGLSARQGFWEKLWNYLFSTEKDLENEMNKELKHTLEETKTTTSVSHSGEVQEMILVEEVQVHLDSSEAEVVMQVEEVRRLRK